MSNGAIPITLKTLHGRFEFHVQRFIDRANPNSLDRTYFDWTGQFQEGYISDRLTIVRTVFEGAQSAG